MPERVVLSIEDSDADFYVIQLALKQMDIPLRMYRVHDGERGVAFLERSGEYADAPRPDLILLNRQMPGKNGFEVLKHVKAHDSLRSIPAVMFTSSSDPRERMRALEVGAEEYVIKHHDLETLVKELAEVCSRSLNKSLSQQHGQAPRSSSAEA